MDIASSDDLKKRKLPLWMLGVSAADSVSKTLDVVSKEDVGVASVRNQPKRKIKNAHREKEALEVEEPSVLVKCRMRRKRGVSKRDDGSNDDGDDDAKEIQCGKKKRGGVGRKFEEPVPLKRRKAESFGFENDDDIEGSSPDDNNDDDLTMEDLMSFAKEYVKDDNDKGQPSVHFRDGNVISSPSGEGLEVKESSIIVKCGSKGRKREVSRPDPSRDSNDKDIGGANKKSGRVRNKVVKPVLSKRKIAKSSGFNSHDDIDVWSPHDDDEDLTMEDLMSMAKEFVEDDNNGVLRAENQPVDAAFHRSETGDTTIDPQILRRTRTHEEAVSRHSSTNNVTSTIIINKLIVTEDPTQDMLDLFLGPYLKKPVYEEKESVVSGDITFDHEVKKQNESLVIGNAPAPLTKKKSSLKDKGQGGSILFRQM